MNKILVVDDDASVVLLVKSQLESDGFEVHTAMTGEDALHQAKAILPDAILLDTYLPGMDGYEICKRLQADSVLSQVPVIFLTAADEVKDKLRAFAAGASDHLMKPCDKGILLDAVHRQIEKRCHGKGSNGAWGSGTLRPSQIPAFAEFTAELAERAALSHDALLSLSRLTPHDLYRFTGSVGISEAETARHISEFLNIPYLPFIDPVTLQLGILPSSFCRFNAVVPLIHPDRTPCFALANPFLLDLVDSLLAVDDRPLAITDPQNIGVLFDQHDELSSTQSSSSDSRPATPRGEAPSSDSIAAHQAPARPRPGAPKQASPHHVDAEEPVTSMCRSLLSKAVAARSTDIHMEPKRDRLAVRFRVDGEMQDAFSVGTMMGHRLLSSFKVMAALDVSEQRRPQDGAFDLELGGQQVRCRVATSAAQSGETMIIRILDLQRKIQTLEDLGMTAAQAESLRAFAGKNAGLILAVGPTGSGKSTTVYSLLDGVDTKTRSLISVEDPIEYLIPNANQQQVNDKIGVTFERLLRSAMRQDPDMLLIGEIRDAFSGRIAVEAASTGHLILSTLHTSNAAAAVFRLEMLGIPRWQMAESLLAVVAQRLVRRLCPLCKEVGPISEVERRLLSDLGDDMPDRVGRPKGCPHCNGTGYFGREVACEVLRVDGEVSQMIRESRPTSDIVSCMKRRGDLLMEDHLFAKVKDLLTSVGEAHKKGAPEEAAEPESPGRQASPPIKVAVAKTPGSPRILIIEDDETTRLLLESLLNSEGFDTTVATDGADALFFMGREEFDLMLSDISMPHLDGFMLLDAKNRKGISTPIIFLTGSADEDGEVKALSAGAADFISKPYKKDALLLRINRVLRREASYVGTA